MSPPKLAEPAQKWPARLLPGRSWPRDWRVCSKSSEKEPDREFPHILTHYSDVEEGIDALIVALAEELSL